MASATRKTVEKTVTESVVVLELSAEEAEWLREHLGNLPAGDGYDIYWSMMHSTKTDDSPIKVGDRVRMLDVPGYPSRVGLIGIVRSIDLDDDSPYAVDCGWANVWFAKSVERAND